MKAKAINLLEGNTGENHCDLVLDKESETGHKKHDLQDNRINKSDSIKIKSFCSFKDTFKNMGQNIYKTCTCQKTCVQTYTKLTTQQ